MEEEKSLNDKLKRLYQKELMSLNLNQKQSQLIEIQLNKALEEYLALDALRVSQTTRPLSVEQQYAEFRMGLAPAKPLLWEDFHKLIATLPDPEGQNINKLCKLQNVFNELYYSIRQPHWHTKGKDFSLVHTAYGMLKESLLPFGTITGEHGKQRHFQKLYNVQNKLFDLFQWVHQLLRTEPLKGKQRTLLQQLAIVLDAQLYFIAEALKIRALRWERLESWGRHDEVYRVLEQNVSSIVQTEEDIKTKQAYLERHLPGTPPLDLDAINEKNKMLFNRNHGRLTHETSYDIDFYSQILAQYMTVIAQDYAPQNLSSSNLVRQKIVNGLLDKIKKRGALEVDTEQYKAVFENTLRAGSVKSKIEVLKKQPRSMLRHLFKWLEPQLIFHVSTEEYQQLTKHCLMPLSDLQKPIPKSSYIKSYPTHAHKEKKKKKRKSKRKNKNRARGAGVSYTLPHASVFMTPQYQLHQTQHQVQQVAQRQERTHSNYAYFVIADQLMNYASQIPNYTGSKTPRELASDILEHALDKPLEPICKLGAT